MSEYLIDVIIPVYNHEGFLHQTLDSIVNQITEYKYRIIPSDDCSTDNTRTILESYARKYPDKIFPVYQPHNIGAHANGYSLLMSATAKYVAVCDGDDYWTDPHKLQKQISFLEANPDFVISFGATAIIDKAGKPLPLEDYFPPITKDVFTIEDFILSETHIIPTATLVYKNLLPKPIPEFYKTIMSGDIFIILMVAHHGKTKYIDEQLAVYRIHSGGITKSAEHAHKSEEAKAQLYERINKLLDYKHDATFRKVLLDLTKARIMYGSRNLNLPRKLKNVIANTGDYFKYSDKINVKEILYYTTVLFFPWVLKAKK
jgi:glycosyltransferase involved in cell wall biosynthesis